MSSLTHQELSQFTGTEHYYRHWSGIKYTDGVKFMAERAQAYWLIDAIVSYRRKEVFQLWTLTLLGDHKAVLTMAHDTDQPLLLKQEIPFTDFPLKSISLYLIEGVLILPSEY